MDLKESITVRVNGDIRRVTVSATIADMLGELGLDARKVAVERNREIVPRGSFDELHVTEGDAFEIVHFVGGG
jgi:thiamine biosynthesis protein ThiS